MNPRKAVCFLAVLLLASVAIAQGTYTQIDYLGVEPPSLTFTSLAYPGASWTVAFGVNSHGWIAGYYGDSSYVNHGFVYRNSTYTSFDFPGGTNTNAMGINDLGDIVGVYEGSDGLYHGFFKTATGFHTLDFPGAVTTQPSGRGSFWLFQRCKQCRTRLPLDASR